MVSKDFSNTGYNTNTTNKFLAAAYLLVSLVPSQPFRANFRIHSLHKLSSNFSHAYR